MDINKYIGLPYKDNGRNVDGIDCWGLACLFYKQEYNIDLPSNADLYEGPNDTGIPDVISQYKDNWEEVKYGNVGDICLFNIYGELSHVGVYLGDRKFLHSRAGQDSVIDSLDNFKWSKRFAGFFHLNAKKSLVQVTGAPHPLRTQVVTDWTVAGTTLQDFADYVGTKYAISDRLASKLVILVDGKVVPKEQWESTVLLEGQTLAYRSIAQGSNVGRMLLMVAVVVAAVYLGPEVGALMQGGGATAASVAGTGWAAAGSMVVNMAGMALINVIAPIRPPGTPQDPGSANALNLFTGASNQMSRFGAIPVVLGKMRVTGVLGATPYVDTLTETSLLNLLIVWGFGPLSITDIQVGNNKIDYYYEGFAQDVPQPVTLTGVPEENVEAFDKLYSRDVEQSQVNVVLTNNTEDGNPWQSLVLSQSDNSAVDVAFTFPEGMRQLVVSGDHAGDINEATAVVELQLRKFNETNQTWPDWVDKPSYASGNYNNASGSTSTPYTNVINSVGYSISSGNYEATGNSSSYVELYQWFTYALTDSGAIIRFDGAASDSQNAEPSSSLLAMYRSNNYNSLLGNDVDATTYTRIPKIPQSGHIKLYTVCIHGNEIVDTINHLSGLSGYTGLAMTATVNLTPNPIFSADSGGDPYLKTGVTVSITNGALYSLSPSGGASTATTQTIFSSRDIVGTTLPATDGQWSQFLKDNSVWEGTNLEFDKTTTVVFPYDGYYHVEGGADDEGGIYIDNRLAAGIPNPGFQSTVSNLVYLEAGTYPVRVKAKNLQGMAAVACKITYSADGYLNSIPSPNTIIVFGQPGMYYKRKDAFNFVFKFRDLVPGRYEIRARRVNADTTEPTTELRNYHKVALLSVTGYSNKKPMRKIPNTYLARTAIRIQSTSKANGSIDGVNAMVHSIALDWDRTTQKWVSRATSNPASLFVHVLLHPGNAYRIKLADARAQIDVPAIEKWHEFCEAKGYEFNSIITQTQSVMDVLRDICAAGLASPTFVDGKWSVIVDRPREYVTQHFSAHNSWGFESNKILTRLPDAFRVTFPDRANAYQANEVLVFNFGKTEENATIFEEIALPGVTDKNQARRLARWHLAQTKLRPERYTLNVDFEYLVCNRGDLVRVNHDVPLWGTGSGRIKSLTPNTIKLSEIVYFNADITYQMRIRLNTISTTPGSDSVLKVLTNAPTSGWYDEVTLVSPIASNEHVEVDNMYMIGEISKESQELVVLNIEPASNLSARLTLIDYSPEIYTLDLDSEAELPSYNTNTSGAGTSSVAQNTITQAPIIISATSDNNLSEEISPGVYQNVVVIGFGNVSKLTDQAKRIQVQVVKGDLSFESNSLTGIYYTDKSSSSLSISGLKTLTIYKIRARYTNSSNTIFGPWSDIFYFTNSGKTINYGLVDAVIIGLDNTNLIAAVSSTSNKPSNFKNYEFRFYKDTGTEDFWDLVPDETNGIIIVQSLAEAKLDLLTVPQPRMSTEGITYRVASRVLDTNNNYSSESALGTFVLTTIQ